jgi:SAM-dependent methyltransferase
LTAVDRTDTEYDVDAEFWDAFYSGTGDIPFYLSLARRFGGPVLDAMCGTGRLAIPLAQAGFETVGMDSHVGMLERARKSSEDLTVGHPSAQKPPRFERADIRSFSLGRTFNLIIVGLSGFLHLTKPADQDAAVSCLKAHLAPEGALVIAVRNPQAPGRSHALALDAEVDFLGGKLARRSEIGADTDSRLLHVKFRWEQKRGSTIVRTAESSFDLRYLPANGLKALLEGAGLKVAESWGGYDGEVLSPVSVWIIHLAIPRGGLKEGVRMRRRA